MVDHPHQHVYSRSLSEFLAHTFQYADPLFLRQLSDQPGQREELSYHVFLRRTARKFFLSVAFESSHICHRRFRGCFRFSGSVDGIETKTESLHYTDTYSHTPVGSFDNICNAVFFSGNSLASPPRRYCLRHNYRLYIQEKTSKYYF